MRATGLSELARYGFEDLSATVGKLDQLVALVGDWGHAALQPLSKAASPDRALDRLIRIAQHHSLSKILAKPEFSLRLCRILGASDGLGEFIERHPVTLEIFAKPAQLPGMDDVAALAGLEFSEVSAGRELIRIRYRELLTRIADFDLAFDDYREPVRAATERLSDIAGAALEAALRLARLELSHEARYSAEQLEDARLAIIAMGKCGARELNYLSDVDVIFVAAGEGDKYLDIATRLATRTMRLLDENGHEPALWQVDANLRPEGKSGALVRSLDSHRSYYERWAENWEFQALLKARPVAGDPELGESYMAAITPLIWSRPNRSELVDGVRRMRARVLENIPQEEREREVKLGRGGLRDIEFTVQLMQLVHGVASVEVRAPDTLTAIDRLAEAGFMGRNDALEFSDLYRRLRALEHRIQLSKLRRDHLLPIDESELRRVARSLSPELKPFELLDQFARTRAQVVTLSDAVFYRPLLNALADIPAGEIRLSDADVRLRLEALGFTDGAGAQRHIQALTEGVARRSIIQRNLLPVLLRWLADGNNPDRGLLSFRRLSEALGETHWYLRMLRDNTGAAQRLMHALSNSELIARLLEYIPESTAWFGDDDELRPRSAEQLSIELSSLINRSEDLSQTAESVRFVRRREILRLAIASIAGSIEQAGLGRGLAQISDAYLAAMLEIARKSCSAPAEVDFAIIAMGRYGGEELGFGSDADCMLVYRAGGDLVEFGDAIAGELQVLVKDLLFAFDLDLDLRPEGKKGPRVRSLESYASYYQRWAEVWEYQALLRARAAIGDQALLDDFVALIDGYRYPEHFSVKAVTEVRRIKARVETERLPQGADPLRHLKLGRGSISDVEWLLQLLQLQHAHSFSDLKQLSTPLLAAATVKQGLLTEQEAERLIAAWSLAGRIRSMGVLATERNQDILPTDQSQLRAVARLLGFERGADLEQHYLTVTRRARKVFEQRFYPAVVDDDA
jgi:glutamate-ammonia-ligase adenylyltransferase